MRSAILQFTNDSQIREKDSVQANWQKIVLLIILGYEAAGCISGGSLLIAAPDGRYMDMPVDIMHGTFRNFLIPGIILFCLGILNILAFIAVLRGKPYDWFLTGLALGGLYLWFIVEIIILQDLHWLHAMWGIPVLMGWVVTIPLIVKRQDTMTMKKILLSCGIGSTLWYILINIIVPLRDANYNWVTQTVSELSAIGAPTRVLWVVSATLYPLLYMALGWGVMLSAQGKRSLRLMGILIIVYSILNFYWPPMHLREVIAAGNGTLNDTLHIVWAMMTLVVNMVLLGLGASAFGKGFRYFTFAIIILFIVFGILIGIEAPGIDKNLPTPGIGIWERINIFAYMSWVAVFAYILMRRNAQQA
jgi:hypothetical protein